MAALEIVARRGEPPNDPLLVGPSSDFFRTLLGEGPLATRLAAEGEPLLSDLRAEIDGIGRGRRRRATFGAYLEREAWELGFEADGAELLVTAYRLGPDPEVLVHERRLELALLGPAPAAECEIATGRERLWPSYQWPPLERRTVSIAPRATSGLTFSTEAAFRTGDPEAIASESPHVERADLHSLLTKGDVTASARGRSLVLKDVHPFLFAERLLSLAEDVLAAFRGARALFRRVALGKQFLGVQHAPGGGTLSLALGRRDGGSGARGSTLVELDPPDFVVAATAFARALFEAFVAEDRAQRQNLRLLSLLRSAEELEAAVLEATLDDSRSNPEPESYRAFGLPRAPSRRGLWEHGGSMRFSPRWVATVPGIDLRGTFPCRDRVVVSAEREIACLESSSGRIAWRVAGPRAVSVATPLGVARLYQDGLIELLDLDTGETRTAARLRPRPAGASGALVNAPGLPRLLVVADGDRSVSALDLVSGDVRWRYSARAPGAFRLRRAGRLMLVAGGDSALSALDVTTGELVWRVRDRLPFAGELGLDRDGVWALAGGPIGPVRLFHIDLWRGELRWARELDARPVPGQAPLLAGGSVVVPVRDARGVGAIALDRTSGDPVWEHEPGLLAPTTAWLAVDDSLIANAASGTLLCLDAQNGSLRYSHVFSRHVEADQPRRLEPVLRNGALFVPQHAVHVLRPRDGAIIGRVPSDLIPDLLRVDEHCNVYVAEESGHVAAFFVAPNLTLVK